ncbi:MAG: chitobiase/beta-hexosaminidase C-terminal domain-containing protein [Bacteroidaceae bacterium]|nr:chitobiase/beta-hexosaminidase C-terminal domain-containing protein [Bacteroidaceae bacterium]
MKKLLLKTLLLLFALVAGSGSVWADDTETFDFTSNNWGLPTTSGTTARTQYTNSSTNQKVYLYAANAYYYYSDKSCLLIGKSGSYIELPSFTKKVTKIDVTYSSGTSENVNVNIYVGSTAVSTAQKAKKSSTNSHSIGSSYQAAGNVYKIQMTNAYNAQISSVKVYFDVPTHTLTYSASNGSISGVVYNTSTAVASGASVAEGGKVTLTATPTSGYTFTGWSVEGTNSSLSDTGTNPTTFTMGTANATVTANFEEIVGEYITASSTSVDIATVGDVAEFELSTNIVSPSYSVAYYTTSAGDETTTKPSWLGDVEFSGNTLDIEVNENNGAARSAYLKVYSGTTYSSVITINQAAITVDAPTIGTSAGAVTAGTTVTLTQAAADQIRYTTDGTDPTISTGDVYSTPIAITAPTTIKAIAVKNGVASEVASAAYTISVAAPTFSLDAGSYMQGVTFTLTSAGNTIYYTTDGSAPSNTTTEYTVPVSMEAGKVTYKAIAYDTYGNTSSVKTCTYTGIVPAFLPFSWAGGVKDDLMALTGVVGNGLGTNYAESNAPYRVKFDGSGDYIEIFVDEKPVKVTIGVKKLGGASNSKIKVQESTNGVEFSDVEELNISGDVNAVVELETSEDFTSSTRVIKLLFNKTGDNVGVGPIGITAATETITLNAACTDGENIYGTYSSSNAFRVPAGLKVSEIQVEGGKLKLTDYEEHNVVPANTGVLVSSTTAGAKTVTISGESGTSVLGTDNLLKPSGDAGITAANMTVANTKFYRLTMHDGTELGFWWGAASGAAFDLGAHKAYLAVPDAVAPVKGFSLFCDDDTDAISQIEDGKLNIENAKIYNLAGQRLSKIQKGINIVSGKKILVK